MSRNTTPHVTGCTQRARYATNVTATLDTIHSTSTRPVHWER
eukprot:CAMPEP_0202843606 /NCGR_PEP_ID=MMETSP1389-20130828/64823_1 /ASSEMBLY_ACC=CAM_ASM_000865 /TAXON_ID=302021 /ORGANISM="Rhodomonas sp., Strain CCMP768" /LENGTH=41 /DNA_ID= /DNA_START= /DNA_END= /DNA_ORIENTATION=